MERERVERLAPSPFRRALLPREVLAEGGSCDPSSTVSSCGLRRCRKTWGAARLPSSRLNIALLTVHFSLCNVLHHLPQLPALSEWPLLECCTVPRVFSIYLGLGTLIGTASYVVRCGEATTRTPSALDLPTSHLVPRGPRSGTSSSLKHLLCTHNLLQTWRGPWRMSTAP